MLRSFVRKNNLKDAHQHVERMTKKIMELALHVETKQHACQKELVPDTSSTASTHDHFIGIKDNTRHNIPHDTTNVIYFPDKIRGTRYRVQRKHVKRYSE